MAATVRRVRLNEFALYVAGVVALAIAALTMLPWVTSWQVTDPALLVVLSVFVLAGELLPIPVPRRHGHARVTISAAFAFAILLRFGRRSGGARVRLELGDRRLRSSASSPLKILFNAAQYALAIVAAGGVRCWRSLGALPVTQITGNELPVVLAAGVAFFVANHLLACTGAGACLPVSRSGATARRPRLPGLDGGLPARVCSGRSSHPPRPACCSSPSASCRCSRSTSAVDRRW